MLHRNAVTTDSEKKKWQKIQSFCKKARDDEFEFAWIDTCCINKDSSAELSEAINSMFQWYRQATKFYVYLADVNDVKQLARSEWFRRGWTLQELLAPRNIQFFSYNWAKLGDKKTLLGTFAALTRIPVECPGLLGVKQKGRKIWHTVSWVIFDVNMPLLYGEEGVKAFLRLQEEIFKVSSDITIFAWTSPQPSPNDIYTLHGLLAESVDWFADSHDILLGRPRYFTGQEPYTMTNMGLRVTFPVVAYLEDTPFTCLAYIYCGRRTTANMKSVVENLGIYLTKMGHIFYRIGTNCLPVIETDWRREPWQSCTIYVPQKGRDRNLEEWGGPEEWGGKVSRRWA
ncbi:hypothetical protein N7481_008973 [Penicillium waksmanii]|uniref:uncharacterized protein n=1 Tax=Penicillium waksmanii TaxID=69791 RepID=UPI0025495A88|nr:uncharacterized protein N7481_008973 [Penicillium waksmanii]KAJ5975266.1 hypothetical protein N7481_008973 [Penicillium waksmanii]